MKENPLVSIIVPVYNTERYLSQCLDSLICQTYRNIEIIVVNDGSTDGSINLLHEYQKRDSRIFLIEQDNQGLSFARNLALKHVKGKYICFVDSDDWLNEDTILYAVKKIESKNVDIVLWGYVKEFKTYSRCVFLSNIETYFDESEVHKLYRRIIGPVKEQLAEMEKIDSFVTVWGKLYCSSIIKNKNVHFVSTKEIGTAEDLLFNIEVFRYVKRAIVIDKCFYYYRKFNNTSFTSVYKKRLFSQWKRLQDLIYERIYQVPDYTEAFYNRVAGSIIGLGLNECSSSNSLCLKYKRLMRILKEERYRRAYRQLDFSYFPVHWKVFFLCAKYRLGWCLLLLLFCIQKIVRR